MSEVKKLDKMFQTLSFKLQQQVAEIKVSGETWQKNVNKELDAFKKKYNEMHGLLLRTFLVKLESRVRLAEINSITLVKLYVHKFYEMEKKIDPSFNLSYEEYYQKLSDEMTAVSSQVSKELGKDDEVAMAKEVEEKISEDKGESDGRGPGESTQTN